jgi:hypothetical protein
VVVDTALLATIFVRQSRSMEPNPLACNIKTISDTLFHRVELTGTWSSGDNDRMVREISAELAEGHNSKVMLDLRGLSLKTSTVQDYSEASSFAEAFQNRPIRVAVLRGSDSVKSLEFREVVASNRGIFVRTFDAEEAAIRWLTNLAKA